MPLQMTYDTLDAIPEPIRDAYVPSDDGKFKLAGFVPEKEILGLKSANERILAEKKTLAEQYGGLTPQQVRELAEADKARQTAEAEKKGEFEKVKEQLRLEADQRVATEKARGDKWETFVDRKLKRADAESAIREAGALDEAAVKVLLPHLVAEIERAEVGEEIKFYVRAEDGKGFRIGAGGAYMTPKEYAETRLKAEYPSLFKANGAKGGGAAGGENANLGPKTMSRATFDKMPNAEKTKYFASGGRVVD